MTRQAIQLGTVPNDKTGDSLRVGGDKINDNFEELYAALQAGTSPYAGSSALLAGAIRYFAVTELNPTDLLYVEEFVVNDPSGIDFHYLLKIYNAVAVDSEPAEDIPWLIWEYTGSRLTELTRITLTEDDGSGVNGVMVIDFSLFPLTETQYQSTGYEDGMLTNFCLLSRWYPFKSKSLIITSSATGVDGSDHLYILKPSVGIISVALEVIELIKDVIVFKNASEYNVNIGVAHTWEGDPVLDLFDFGGGVIVLEPGKSVEIKPVDGVGENPPFFAVTGEYSLPPA